MRQIVSVLVCCVLLIGCTPVPAGAPAVPPLSLNYDPSPDTLVLYADVQPYPVAPLPGEECLARCQPRLRIWGDGLVYVDIARAGQPPPFRWQGKFDRNRMTELLRFLEIGGFFDAWNPGEINPAATSFRMGANLEATQVQYEGGDLDPPLYHQLVEDILPSLTPLPESGHIDERIAVILREAEDCQREILGTATP